MAESFSTGSADETLRLGARLVAGWPPGTVIALHGDLGAGKTHFVKGVARGLGLDASVVTSPTFTIVHEYGEPDLVHIDGYRVESEREWIELGVHDLFAGPWLTAVEWPERLGSLLPEERVDVWIRHLGPDRRQIEIVTRD